MTNAEVIRRFLNVNSVNYFYDEAGAKFKVMDSTVSEAVISGLVYMKATVTLKNGQLEVY
jgi:hypothetical protein